MIFPKDITKNEGGIYEILNTINEKRYIGSTNCFRIRFDNHRRELRKGCHYNSFLQDDWNKYGELNFTFNIVEIINDMSLLINREQYYFYKYPFTDIYNIVIPDQTHNRSKRKSNPVYKINIETRQIIDKYDSAKMAAQAEGVSVGLIYAALQGRISHAKNYIWIYIADYNLGLLDKNSLPINAPIYKVTRSLDRLNILGRFKTTKEASEKARVRETDIIKALETGELGGWWLWIHADNYTYKWR